jgi:hypothetical protein
MIRTVKAWLRKNQLTPDPNDYIATVELQGSATINDVVGEMKKDGMEIKAETAKDVITRFNDKCLDLLTMGYRVNTGIVYMHPSIKGVLYDKHWDPARNTLHVSISQGPELRAAIAETNVEIMGEHPDPTAIYSITDLSTGKTDGTITIGFAAEIKGTYIRVVGDDPTCGLYLRNVATQADYKLPERRIAKNEPSRVMIIVPPDLPADTYDLRIVTQFTSAQGLLNAPRTILFAVPITVVQE